MRLTIRLVTLAVLLVTANPLAAQLTRPKTVTGRYVLQRIHDAYANKWYKTLTFMQKTTRYRSGGATSVETWYESMRTTPEFGTQLRIDIGDLLTGRGVLYTADSSVQVTAGKPAAIRPDGNEFIPLIQGVYVEPVAQTMEQLTRLGFDVTKAHQSVYEGLPVWVVGATNDADTLSSRFVIDTVRKVVTHAVLIRTGQPPIDVSLRSYVRAGNGWLATKVEMTLRGRPIQTEEYYDWKIDTPLPASLFDVQQWSTSAHWEKKQ